MSMPGFKAEASLYGKSGHYQDAAVSLSRADGISPAALDVQCYKNGHPWCGPDCSDLSGAPARAFGGVTGIAARAAPISL